MSWPCADMSGARWDDGYMRWITYRCRVCNHTACHPGHPCETCATNRRIDQLIGDDK